MKLPIDICGKRYLAEMAAITCVRYRSLYGVSPLAELTMTQKPGELKAKLAKLAWVMVQPCDEEFGAFAAGCVKEKTFAEQMILLRAELFRPDERFKPGEQSEPVTPEEFDEFDHVVARMAQAGLSDSLLYELPVFQLLAVINRIFTHKNGAGSGKNTWVKMTPQDVGALLGA